MMLYSDQTKKKLQFKSERNYLGQNAPFGGTQMKFPQLFAVTQLIVWPQFFSIL